MRRSDILYVLAMVLIIAFILWMVVGLVCSDPARAEVRDTGQVIYEILAERDSPLADEAYTVVAFRRAQGPDFKILDFYALLWAESNLGRDSYVARHHNVGSIIGGSPGTLWRDLRIGTTGSRSYNVYGSFRDGQRAALRLVMERYNGSVLRNGLLRWYGAGVPGWAGYQADIRAAKAILLKEGEEHGLNPVHLQ